LPHIFSVKLNELATIDIHFSYRTVQSVHKLKAGCD